MTGTDPDERMFAMAEGTGQEVGRREKDHKEKLMKRGLPFLCVALPALFLAFRYGFYFSSNDDSLLKAILSGAFTGAPETRDMQHLYPLSALFALLYRMCPAVPWYGLILCGAQFGALYLCLVRCAGHGKGLGKKALGCVVAVSLFAGLMLRELVMIQYTVVSATLAAASVFLLVTDERREETVGRFLLHRLPCLVLYAAAFALRSEMGLFLLPFLLVGCAYKWLWDGDGEEECRKGLPGCVILAALLLLAAVTHVDWFFVLACLEILRGTVWCLLRKGRGRGRLLLRYALFLLCLMGTMGALYAMDAVAYRSGEWREARAFFDSRTTLYDFGKIPPYAESRELYEGLGISEEGQMLLENYNFALSDAYDSKTLGAIEAYQEKYFSYVRTVEYVKKVILDVVKRMTTEPDLPYGVMLIAAYGIAVLCFALTRRYTGAYLMTYVLMAHVVCWGYLTWKNRLPERVTHGLYLTEIVTIAALCLRQYWRAREVAEGGRECGHAPAAAPAGKEAAEEGRECSHAPAASAGNEVMKFPREPRQTVAWRLSAGKALFDCLAWILLGALGIYGLSCNAALLRADVAAALEAERNWTAVRSYCEANPEALYLLDTLSFASYVEKAFEEGRGIQNHTLCGGWSVNTPAWDRKLAAFGVQESLFRSIQEGKEFYFIMEAGRDVEWLRNFFRAEDLGVEVRLTDILIVDGGLTYEVYRIAP